MQAYYGQRNTTSASEKELYINIEKNVRKFPAMRREVVQRLDGSVFEKDVTSHRYDWSIRPNRPMRAKLAQAVSQAATTLIVDTPGVFNVDDVISLGGQQARVAVVTGGDTLTVAALPGETLPASDIGTDVFIISGGTPHGKKADTMVTTGYEDLFNYVGNFEDVVDISSTDHASNVRGRENSAKLITRKQMELTEKLQRAIVFGKRAKDNAQDITYMGGMKNMIDLYAPENALDFGGSAIWNGSNPDRAVQEKLDEAFRVISEKAFKKPVMWVSERFMNKFKYIQTGNTYTTNATPEKRGIGVVRKYDTNVFGSVDVVQLQGLDGLMDDFIFVTDESDIGYKPLVSWRTYPLAKEGQSYRWQVEGIYTFMMGIPQAHVYFYNLGL
jgi:hypothetical protein